MLQGSPQFETTLWSQVLLAAQERNSDAGREALERLCSVYWYPIYAFIRRRGVGPVDAQDLTQGFFEHILSGTFLSRVDPSRGKFRSYVLGAVRNYLSDERARATAEKRGGKNATVSIDVDSAELRITTEPTAQNDSTHAFDRSWATALVDCAVQELRAEENDHGRGDLFNRLKEFITRNAQPGEYTKIAADLGTTEGALKVAVHRLSGRYAQLVKKAIRDTVASKELADEELDYLRTVLRG